MAPNSLECRTTEERATPRASIYLAAALYCDGTSSPVKIRNISTTGALVEGGTVPSPGSLVQLVRGGLIVHGLVAWAVEGRCGLKFSGSVDVQRWRAAPTNAEQQRVDDVVRLVKAGAVPLPIPPLAHQVNSTENDDSTTDLSGDLNRTSKLLESLGATLSSDRDVVARHGAALQSLDIAMQILAAVDAVIAGRADRDNDPSKLASLRRSADQALRRLD
ncbi:MAG TPA: hypothetical protein VGU01_03445 [Sphingomicrobium sp.]|nr:hypothetical protein [Sphingomicrobium sp.]